MSRFRRSQVHDALREAQQEFGGSNNQVTEYLDEQKLYPKHEFPAVELSEEAQERYNQAAEFEDDFVAACQASPFYVKMEERKEPDIERYSDKYVVQQAKLSDYIPRDHFGRFLPMELMEFVYEDEAGAATTNNKHNGTTGEKMVVGIDMDDDEEEENLKQNDDEEDDIEDFNDYAIDYVASSDEES
eukprot:TRINITY_DN3600_c2_g1_i1.p1 TRINITY_DN3600_c2_g1~~TRINITY_DN3600_c2_g1_i1.p1  ORF type:complete len:187 (+),score=58.43 TRINITY_DN3600_c2_g1_i1:116-676(+)